MKHSTLAHTSRAVLAAIGIKMQQLHLFEPVVRLVKIGQKSIRHTPAQKLYDAFISLLCGAHGLVEINTLLRSDPALGHAFGRSACAEQSVVQETLDACTKENVSQMRQAFNQILRKRGRSPRHRYEERPQLLDVDQTGLPAGAKCEFATKGYFAHQRHRRGRQLGRVLASRYQEIVAEQLYEGTKQLPQTLRSLVEAAEEALGLDETKRARTILRVDSGGGTSEDINWVLSRGYLYHGKDYSGRRAKCLAQTVTEWVPDPNGTGREVGWVNTSEHPYVRPVRRIAVRCPRQPGGWSVGVLVSTLSPEQVILETRQPIHKAKDPLAVLFAYVYFYDARGGGVETANKEDKQGLGLTKRNKKRFAAQEMLVLLSALAHNVIIWAREWLLPDCPRLARYGILRLVRDVFAIGGQLSTDEGGGIHKITLNPYHPLASALAYALDLRMRAMNVAVNLGQT